MPSARRVDGVFEANRVGWNEVDAPFGSIPESRPFQSARKRCSLDQILGSWYRPLFTTFQLTGVVFRAFGLSQQAILGAWPQKECDLERGTVTR